MKYDNLWTLISCSYHVFNCKSLATIAVFFTINCMGFYLQCIEQKCHFWCKQRIGKEKIVVWFRWKIQRKKNKIQNSKIYVLKCQNSVKKARLFSVKRQIQKNCLNSMKEVRNARIYFQNCVHFEFWKKSEWHDLGVYNLKLPDMNLKL